MNWRSAPETIVLSSNGLDVWRVFYSEISQYSHFYEIQLSNDEIERANRFYQEGKQRKYVIGRSILRHILGRYLNVDGSAVRFTYNLQGKPFLADDSNLCFNVSHSRNVMLIAVTAGTNVGVDVEYIREDALLDQVAQSFFSENEIRILRSLSKPDRQTSFFLGWTRKEAYIKARDLGLSLPLSQFDVSMKRGEPAQLLVTSYDPAEAVRWSIFNLEPADHYAAAVAVEGQNHHLRLFAI
jgi:4'-phosphopantetheinyl transferase